LPGLAGLVLLAACGAPVDTPMAPASLCQDQATRISDIQGQGLASPLAQAVVMVRGTVTRVEPGRGFYLEEGQLDRQASRALFVADENLSRNAHAGQVLGISGRVVEQGSGRDTLTSLVVTDGATLCAENSELPLTHTQLPLDPREREALEGMRLAFDAPLWLTEHYDMYRGEWTLSADAPLRVPTEDTAPGSAAAERAERNRDNALQVLLPGPDFPALPVGATISRVQGVLGQQDDEQRLLLESTPRAAVPDTWTLKPPEEGLLRVVSLNLLNYFNGDGQGGGFPTARGAQNPEEFKAQQGRTAAAIAKIQPDLLAVQELENDGFGRLGAAQSLVDLLNSTGSSDWAFIDPAGGPIGSDIITVGLFYRLQALAPIGPPELLHGPAFSGLSRVPLAQLFRVRASGAQFLVAVNHLKSKGRCPDGGPNADHGDGQGCWNSARVEAVRALGPWLSQLAAKSGTREVLILGDMNAWRQEDPIRSYRDAGYTELVEALAGLPQHSFVYFGQRGTLDYALATPSLRKRARQAMIWHINADWPRNMTLPRPWLRMSDHDPVVVDFDFSQSATSD
jgi:predicted extracellular nuclease